MTEPLDPATVGVASILKSLRTRTGLREDRLDSTEPDLDALTGLDIVQALVISGESAGRAIVRAVQAATATLPPTLSIVADVSLGLELSADQVLDPELYGGDTAGLRAWDNGDLPIWLTFDAIEALRLASLAVPARPAWSP